MELIYLLSMEDPDRQTSVLTSYYKFKQGGLCTRLLRTMHALLDSGYKVHYLSTEPFPISHPNCIHHKLFWPSKNNDSFLFWIYFALVAPLYIFAICRKHKITNLFVFDIFYAFCMRLASFLLNLPLSIFLRADNITNHEIKSLPKFIIYIETIVEKISFLGSNIICVSKKLRSNVSARHKNISIDDIKYLPNDIQIVNKHYERSENNLVRFSCVGVYEDRKNQLFLIDVMKNLKNKNWELNFFGEGYLRERICEKITNESLEEKIILKGWVDKKYIWQNTDLLLMPSLHEGAPNAVLEALGHRIPVIASHIEEHCEILPDECALILNVPTWVSKLDSILKSPYKKLHENSAAQELKINNFVFNWDKAVVEHIVQRNN